MAEKIDPPAQDKEVLSQADGLDELDILGTESAELTLSDRRVITIAPMKMKQVREFMKVGSKFLAPLQAALGKKGKSGEAAPEVDLQAIAAIDQEAFMQCVSIGSGLSVDELDELFPNDFVLIVGKIMVMNLDFFAQTMPMVLVRVKLSVVKTFDAAMARLVRQGTVGPSLLRDSKATESESTSSPN